MPLPPSVSKSLFAVAVFFVLCTMAFVVNLVVASVSFGDRRIPVHTHTKPQNTLQTFTSSGDPDGPVETLTFDLADAKRVADESFAKKGPKLPPDKLAARMLVVARGYLGVNRVQNKSQINSFANVWCTEKNKVFCGDKAYKLAFCAMGVTYATCKAYCDLSNIPYQSGTAVETFRDVIPDVNKNLFTPNPLVATMVNEAKARKQWKVFSEATISGAKPGWLVVYDWPDVKGYANHIGIVESVSKGSRTTINTIEFNVSMKNQYNGGAVARKSGRRSNILGFIVTH